MKEITLIKGLLNCDGIAREWELPNESDVNIGDYVIVENKKDYDLVKVIGITVTHEDYIPNFIGNMKLKKAVKVISKECFGRVRGVRYE